MAESPFTEWVEINIRDTRTYPPEDTVVDTKIDDRDGCRNERPLRLYHGRFFSPDKSLYMYYVPTHWKRSTHPRRA